MAAAVSVPNTFVAATTAQSAQVNADFTALVTWINTNAVHLDATKAFTGIVTGPASDPVGANDLSRKSYVDAQVKAPPRTGCSVTVTNQSVAGGAAAAFVFSTEVWDTDAFFVAPSTTVTIPASFGGLYLIDASFSTASGTGYHDVRKNGTVIRTTLSGVGGSTGSLAVIAPLVAGDTLTVFMTNLSGVNNFSGALSIARLSL